MTPSSRFLLSMGLASLPVILTVFGERVEATLIPTVVVFIVALVDRKWGTDCPVDVVRRVRPVLSVGVENPVNHTVRNNTGRWVSITLIDEVPEQGRCEPEFSLQAVRVPPYSNQEATYSFFPSKRGQYTFGGIHLCYKSRMGMWSVTRRFEASTHVSVYPNIEAIHRFELLARVNNLSEMGVRSIRMKGEGTEFERMREYRPGDEPRKVDWKTTARMGKLIVREMEQERNQNLVLLIDMGRMMQQTTDGLSHFDYALNTAIVLTTVAEKKGDTVGAVFFSDRVKRYIPLSRGRGKADILVKTGYAMEPEPVATNFGRLFRYLMTQIRKRSLVVLMTHLSPGEDHRLIQEYMKHLGGHHLPLVIFFREPALERESRIVSADEKQLFRRAAAGRLLLERKAALETLNQAGVMALDTLPGELSTVAISSYLDIKARNLL